MSPRGAVGPASLFTATLLAVLLFSSCGPDSSDAEPEPDLYCTEMPCSDQFQLSIVSASGTFESGWLGILILADGEAEQDCEIRISDDPSECLGVQPCVKESTCSAVYAVWADPQSLIFDVGGTPDVVAVEVKLDDSLVAERSFSPEYAVFRPNGDLCPPACMVDDDEFLLP